MLQQNPERESVRDQWEWHDESRNEIDSPQLSRQQLGVIGRCAYVQTKMPASYVTLRLLSAFIPQDQNAKAGRPLRVG